LVNAIFASGGPSPQGSLRHIQVRRDGATITDFDFYDLLIQGDKSKDVHLQSGDVLYIPHVGPLVAISGSVNNPAIYEMKSSSTLNELIEISGDLSSLADTSKITIERLVDHASRKTFEFPYDEQSRITPLQDADIVHVFSIVPSFQDTVTLRGHVANPGRYPWTPGMRIRDLIPNTDALLTRDYWRDRAAIVTGKATEYPVRTERPRNPCFGRGQRNAANPNSTNPNAAKVPGLADSTSQSVYPDNQSTDNAAQDLPCTDTPEDSSPDANADKKAVDSSPLSETTRAGYNPNSARDITDDLRHYAPEINWDYAIIQRVNPTDLSSKLLWINPRKAILEHDESSNLALEAGDIITIFSQRDISVPQSERSRYVIIEGEVNRPGVYKLETDDTLRAVLDRAGGLTPNAYVYGSQLTRESARIEQQKSLDELVRNMEVQVRQSALSIAASAADAGQVAQLQAAQEGIISHLRGVRATGRVSLPVRPSDQKLADFPNMLMEDSDRVMIPHIPSTVSVVGNVYNPGSFIFDPHITSGTYLDMAGKGKPQSDLHHAFVLRANGVVVAANNVNGLFTGTKFDRLRLYPGDQIVVPYKLPTGAFVRGLRDWSQIASQMALLGAAIAVIR
jgi:protein involved in polysaccharide export with SLBB domain